MARRYGRNQRRQHRERVAELEKALQGGWPKPKPSRRAFELSPGSVKSYTDQISEERREGREREIDIYCWVDRPLEDAILNARHGCGYVVWRGVEYALVEVDLMDTGSILVVHLRLHAYAEGTL